MVLIEAEASSLALTLPKLLKVTIVVPAGLGVTVTSFEPSLELRESIVAGQLAVTVSQPTTHDDATPKVNCTLAFRDIASPRAFCKPFTIASPALRI
jgi:hypothetical protein